MHIKGYRVEEHEYGVLVFGSIPVHDMVKLTKVWSKRGMTAMAIGVASALGATMAICAKKDIDAWEKEVNDLAAAKAGGNPELSWLNGTDTGSSSRTIFSVLGSEQNRSTALCSPYRPDIPHDPSDFGRCVRLLALFPEWKSRLHEVSSIYPSWAPIVAEWDSLERHYHEELPTGLAPKLYERLQELQKPNSLNTPTI